jgi:N-acetylglucosaminyldiphosphoundecaprenol N-acetyl-beta-D-mannosaminyltransferase
MPLQQLIVGRAFSIIQPLMRPTRAIDQASAVPRVNVLGVGISALNLDEAVGHVARALESGGRGYVCVTGVHGVSEAQADAEFRAILNQAWLNTPDGMPMVWMGKLQGMRSMGRVYGPDLMLRVCEYSSSRGHRHFLYGGADGVAQELKQRLETRYPGLQIVGARTPPFRALSVDEESELAREVARLKPDIVWVGLSTPKQERFMAEHWRKLDARLFFGVGAAFDFHTGRVRQAPRWMQRCGLEWLFRLGCEPRRLWRRYLKNNPLFLLRAGSQLSGLRRYPCPEPELKITPGSECHR